MEKNEVDSVGEELEKLFVFQDKHLTKEKKAILVNALLLSSIPVPALILGIRKLMNDELSSIKLNMIFAASRNFVEPNTQVEGCRECTDGNVIMRDEEGRWFSLSCQCGAGISNYHTNRLKKWGGENTQIEKGRILSKVNTERLVPTSHCGAAKGAGR